MAGKNVDQALISKLTKAEIIENIYNKLNDKAVTTNKKEIHQVLEAFFQEIKGGLSARRVVELRGFGTFELRLRKGREKARNPRTGETLPVESHSVAVFRPGKELKNDVWNIK
jgi:nucleoid DNA-binding protein